MIFKRCRGCMAPPFNLRDCDTCYKRLVDVVREHPYIYRLCDCSSTECEKHITKINTRQPYLLASMKGTPYCLEEDPEVYEHKDITKL